MKPKIAKAVDVQFLHPGRLRTHPKNMRRFYPDHDVQEMANSIQAQGGVLQAMLVVPGEETGVYYVVDGNMRLAGARRLGDKCPPLKCEVLTHSKAEQVLDMIVANQVRYDVDPVSEGMHYQMLADEGLSVRDISKQTGVYEARIGSRMLLAKLEEPVRRLIAEDKLPCSADAARALLALKPSVQIKLATKLAENPNARISTVVTAATKLRADLAPAKKMRRPSVELTGIDAAKGEPPSWIRARDAARQTCNICNLRAGALATTPEPAWGMIAHTAGEVCESCNLIDMQKLCGTCPVVQFLRRLIPQADKKVKSNGHKS